MILEIIIIIPRTLIFTNHNEKQTRPPLIVLQYIINGFFGTAMREAKIETVGNHSSQRLSFQFAVCKSAHSDSRKVDMREI
jgi:hypothetical protein